MIKHLIDYFCNYHPTAEIELIEDKEHPFPEYELEITWNEWRWNDAGTDRLDETNAEGVTINPIDYTNEDGYIDGIELGRVVAETLVTVMSNPEREGAITVRG